MRHTNVTVVSERVKGLKSIPIFNKQKDSKGYISPTSFSNTSSVAFMLYISYRVEGVSQFRAPVTKNTLIFLATIKQNIKICKLLTSHKIRP